ncbi:MAG TPA: hypothetical protein VMV16_02215 [Solirubrobacteraceae bacterium]|nr:hypothetical protein [Solirubrobacteraceae bacterium]
MTDVLDQVAAHNPVRADDLRREGLTLSFEDLWRHLNHAQPQPHRRPLRLSHPAVVGGAASALAATLAAALLSAGGAPSVAQAFPILASPAVDLSHRVAVERSLIRHGMAPSVAAASLKHAHEFTTAAGNGFTFEASNGAQICLITYPPSGFFAGQPDAHNGGCDSTATAEQNGMITAAAWGNSSEQLQTYEALVPTGGTLEVTTDGTTSAVPVPADGIVTGVVQQGTAVSVSITVNGATTSQQISQP